jgi:hypothetical protein
MDGLAESEVQTVSLKNTNKGEGVARLSTGLLQAKSEQQTTQAPSCLRSRA